MNDEEGKRLNKYLSEVGFCSRRDADKFIENGRVLVNGKKPLVGAKIQSTDQIMVDGQLINEAPENHVYIAFNKPEGIVSTTDTENERDNIIEYINHEKRIFPIGRLDKQSEGLIFLTSDGDIVNKILRAGNKHEKEYVVTVDRPITKEFILKMGSGVPILGATTKKCFIEQTKSNEFRIILTQGMNRQIRRMCEYFHYEVVRLKRIRIMNISLDIASGSWRNLRDAEVDELKRLTVTSTGTDIKKEKKKPSNSIKKPKPEATNSNKRKPNTNYRSKSSSNKAPVKAHKKPSNRAAAAKKNLKRK
jgi:23S rRNA pseudouridine2604 synthase